MTASFFTRYDILSRPVISGRYKGAATPGSSEPLYETPSTSGPHYYTSTSFPTDNNLDVYQASYYDDYDLDNNGTVAANESYTNPAESGYETAAFLRTRGKATAVRTAILKNDNSAPATYLTTRTYYDKEYSVIQVNKQNHLSGADITSNAYDFANRLVKTRRDHSATPPGGTAKFYVIREEYTLDHAGRTRFTRHHIGTSTAYPASGWVVTSAPLYDERGRLADKRLHAGNYDGASAISLGSNFSYLQSLDYTYNIRDWLTAINDPSGCTLQPGDDQIDLFSMKLEYETVANGGTPLYNGNIINQEWSVYNGACGTRQLYRYYYDAANRLTTANHYYRISTIWYSGNRYSATNLTYDLNGNLKTLKRRGLLTSPGTYGDIDNLTYYYDDIARPDRLTRVVDAASATKGFVYNASASSPHYSYDLNGNLTQDQHKNMTVGYNHLNLPNSFMISGNAITMSYTASGEKLSKTGGGVTKNYVSGIEYSGANLEAIYHAEGRCTPNGSTFYYEYTLKDHLGNARVNWRANGTAVTFLEDLHYYPFGMLMEGISSVADSNSNKYRFDGIEQNEELGLNLGLAFYRSYDPTIGRWWQVDPKPNLSISCYSGLANNPLSLSDNLGDTTRVYTTHGRYVGTINDSEENQEHFVSLKRKGVREQKKMIKKVNQVNESANQASKIVRGGSKYFIGRNTRQDIKKISSTSVSEKAERLFALSYSSDNKELRATDITSDVGIRSVDRLNVAQSEEAIKNFIEGHTDLSVIGWGHIHPQKIDNNNQNHTMSKIHSPSYPGDFNNLGIVNPIDGGIGNNPSILATRYGYIIYTTADPYYNPGNYEGGLSPSIYNFSGKKIFNLTNDDDN